MIDLVEGEGLGAGKSYYLATVFAAHVASGGTVCYTDDFVMIWDRIFGPLTEEETSKRRRHFGGYRFKVEGFKEYVMSEYGVIPERDQLREFKSADTWRLHNLTPQGTDECPVLICVDEAQGGLNARDTKDADKRPLFDWACQSRHDDNNLIFCTQDVGNLDIQMKRLASNLIVTTNLARDGGFPVIGPIKAFLWRIIHPESNKQTGWKFKRFDRRVMLAYDSKACAGKHARVGEIVKKKKLAKVEKKPMKLIGWLAIGGILFGGYRVYTMFHDMAHPKVALPVVTPTKLVNAASQTLAGAVTGGVGLPPATPPPLYRVIEEEYQGGDGRSYLHTAGGQYMVGEMSVNGYVEMIGGHVARVKDPWGKLFYIVGKEKGHSVQAVFTPAPAATPWPKAGEASIMWTPAPQPFSEGEQARIRAELLKPVGVDNASGTVGGGGGVGGRRR